MAKDSDWKVTAILIWLGLAPVFVLFGFAHTYDRLDELQEQVNRRPVVVQGNPTCIRSENSFGWWKGREEINCGQ